MGLQGAQGGVNASPHQANNRALHNPVPPIIEVNIRPQGDYLA